MIWDDAKIVAFDFETSGVLPEYALQPWRIPSGQAWATSMSIIRHDGEKLVRDGSMLYPKAAHMRAFLEDAISEGWIVTGWNIVFDITVLIAYGLTDLVMQVQWLDAMLLWRHLEVEPEYEFQGARHKKKSYALKPGGLERWKPERVGREEDVSFHATDPASLKLLQTYNDDDSIDTWDIAKIIWHKLEETQQRAAWIETACLPMVAEANFHGMLIDALGSAELAAQLDDTAATMLEKLAPHGVTEKVVRSPVQLSKLLFDDWGLKVLKENTSKKTGKVSRSTDKEVLHELAFEDARCADLRRYREALNNRTKFADAPVISATYNGDGYSRPSAIVFGTYSGRLTYASAQGRGKDSRPIGFALHQMKGIRKAGDEIYRDIIEAPPGYTLVEFDAAGQEFRWMAIASDDPTMLQLCLPGEDPHSFMGSRIVERDYRELIRAVDAKEDSAKNARQLGKVANLSLQYRTSARKLRSVARVQYDIPMEMPEAQRIHSTYQRSYPGVPDYWVRQISLTKTRGWVETFAGRRVKVVGDWDGEWGWSMGSTSINYRIQGTGADQKYLALQVLKPYVHSIGGRFAWDLHDGIYWYIPDDVVNIAVPRMKQLLDNLPYQQAWGFTPPIPLPWDAKAGKTWGGLSGWKFD